MKFSRFLKRLFYLITILSCLSWIAADVYGTELKQTETITRNGLHFEKRTVAIEEKRPPKLPEKIILDVPLIEQMKPPRLYNGCEVTSLAMLLNYHSIKVTKNELANTIKRIPMTDGQSLKGNPNNGFVGNMEDGPGLGVYHGPIFELAKNYAGDRVIDLTNEPFTHILERIGQGFPVWVITTSSFSPVSSFEKWETAQGAIYITFSQHSVVLTGFDKDYVYLNDPYGVKNRKVDRENFIQAWKQMGSQAISL